MGRVGVVGDNEVADQIQARDKRKLCLDCEQDEGGYCSPFQMLEPTHSRLASLGWWCRWVFRRWSVVSLCTQQNNVFYGCRVVDLVHV